MKIIFAIFTMIVLQTAAQAAPGYNGVEYKYVSGFIAHRYYDAALKNDAKHTFEFLNRMSKEDQAKWRKENESPIAPSVSSSCEYTTYVSNEVKPIGADVIHAVKNGQKFGNREMSLVPFVTADCTQTTNPGYTSTYNCMLTFEYTTDSSSDDAAMKSNNAAVEKYAPVVELKNCMQTAAAK